MKTYSPLFLLAALACCPALARPRPPPTPATGSARPAPTPRPPSRATSKPAWHVSAKTRKFGDFTGLERKRRHLVLGGALRVRGAGGYYADLQAANLGLDTRSLGVHSGHEGLYDAAPGLPSCRATLPTAPDTLPGQWRQLLTLPAGYPAATTAGDAAGQPPCSRWTSASRRSTWTFGPLLSFQHWTYRVSFKRDVRDGTRPLTTAVLLHRATTGGAGGPDDGPGRSLGRLRHAQPLQATWPTRSRASPTGPIA
jgi:hypothetical protein